MLYMGHELFVYLARLAQKHIFEYIYSSRVSDQSFAGENLDVLSVGEVQELAYVVDVRSAHCFAIILLHGVAYA